MYHALNATLNANLPGFEVKHLRIIRKSTMLVIIANVSTWCFVLGQALILRQLGFYLPFDGVINSLCIACLFQFGDDFYSVTCAKLECLCLCFGPQCNCWSAAFGCWCCGDVPGGSEEKKKKHGDAATFTTSDEEDKYHPQYHAKIHSHRPLNGQDNAGYASWCTLDFSILNSTTDLILWIFTVKSIQISICILAMILSIESVPGTFQNFVF